MNCLDLTSQTPAEIDRQWADAEATLARPRQELAETRKSIRRYDRFGKVPEYLTKREAQQVERLREASKVLDPFKAEWERRGGWTRYELCLGGHVHRHSPRCSSLHPTSATVILAELTDLTERRVVELKGFAACTICFPWAPTVPAFQAGQKASEEAEAAKQAGRCPGSGKWFQNPTRRLYLPCPDCGTLMRPTPTGAVRAHNKPKAKAAK
jgi:hypothetical protein